MTTVSQKPKKAWTRGEKALLATIVIVLALTGLGGWLYQHDAQMPTAINIPTPVMPPQDAYNVFVAAANAEVQGNAVDNAESHYASGANLTLSQKSALVQANAAVLRLLRHGLTLPYQAPPVRSYFANPMPADAGFREIARLLILEAQVDQAQGNWIGAANAGLDADQEGVLIQQHSTLLGRLVGLACQAIGQRMVWADVDHLTALQAEAAARRMERIEAQENPFAETLQEEEWAQQASLLQLLRAPNWQQGLVQGLFSSQADGLGARDNLSLLFTSRRQVYDNLTRAMNAQIAQARQPYSPQDVPPPATGDPLSRMMQIDYHGGRVRAAQEDAENGLLAVTLALRAYKLEQGRYPSALAALVPAYLAHIPDDPFAPAGPLRYKLQGGKYVLYSIGPDAKDDGGKPIFDASKPAPKPGEIDRRYAIEDDSKGDIVAGVNL